MKKGGYVWLVNVDVGRGWELRVIASTETKASKYSKAFRNDPTHPLPPKIYIEKCEIDHAFGMSMLDYPRGYNL